MTKAEFGKFAMALKTYYPKESLFPNNQAIELWYAQLGDLDYRVAEVALNKWVATNKWSPTIADIREGATAISEGEAIDWSEGWEKVQKAIRKYGYYNSADAMASFDDVTRMTVHQMGGFKVLCMSENEVADRANFRMIFERMTERKKNDSQLPEQLKAVINQMRIGMIEEDKGHETIPAIQD